MASARDGQAANRPVSGLPHLSHSPKSIVSRWQPRWCAAHTSGAYLFGSFPTRERKGVRTMARLRILGVAALTVAISAPHATAQRGGAVRSGVRGAAVGGLVGG